MGAIYRREMGAFFTSGVAYVFLVVFYFVSGIFFYNYVLAAGVADVSPVFQSMFLVVMFLIPILTMKLLSEEKKNRTDQGLLTAPVGLWEIVLGKYFAALTLFIIAESIVFVYAIILSALGNVVWQTLIGNYFAMLFLGAAFIAVGLFISSLTENQVVAAVVSFISILTLNLLSILGGLLPWKFLQNVFTKLSFYERYSGFTFGLFDLSNVLFFISAIVVFLFLTVRVLEKRRWS